MGQIWDNLVIKKKSDNIKKNFQLKKKIHESVEIWGTKQEGEKLFFIGKCQLINVEEMIELASHHFATINVIATQAKIISLDNHWVKGVMCCNLGGK